MEYELNTYCALNLPNKPRAVFYPDGLTCARLRNHYENKGYKILHITDCMDEADDCCMPMPARLLTLITKKIHAANQPCLVHGFDAYLYLIDASITDIFWNELRKILEDRDEAIVYMLHTSNRPDFPQRFYENRKAVLISGSPENISKCSIRVYSDNWVNPQNHINGFRQLMRQIPKQDDDSLIIVISGMEIAQSGLSNCISFITNIREVAKQYYKIDTELDENALRTLLPQLAQKDEPVETFTYTKFGPKNLTPQFALKRLIELTEDPLWHLYTYYLRKWLPGDSYLRKVLSDEVQPHEFLKAYVVDAALKVIYDSNAKSYAEERYHALTILKANYESLIIQFINKLKESGVDKNKALLFLNCGTGSEKMEILRHVQCENLDSVQLEKYESLFPSLKDYLSIYDYGNEQLNVYFQKYRKNKLMDCVPDDFIELAFSSIMPDGIPSRDTLLSSLRTQNDTALLVIDAMGAEYLPLLIALARRRGICIEETYVATTRLPTTTLYNNIEWVPQRRLPDIKSLDNLAHNGATAHESNSFEQNFVEALQIFEEDIIKRIAEGLNEFPRLVITADHGTSRLAILAHKACKSITLPWQGEPDDWRFSHALPNEKCPYEMESEYYPEVKETYWIVRGYNRLPKKGGKLYELHGGATLEERLVPFIVLTRDTKAVPRPDNKNAAEIVDEFEGII